MKTFNSLLIVLSLSLATTHSQWVDLGVLGTDNFTIDVGSVGDFSQTSTELTFNSFTLGDGIYGFYTLSNWSAYSDFGIRIDLASNPNQPFSFFIYDSSYTGIPGFGVNEYSGDSSVLQGNVIPLTLVSSSANLADVVGIEFGLNGTSSTSMVATNISAVPEPSTYALLALGGLALGCYVLRNRRGA
jgi:hypothetical protein